MHGIGEVEVHSKVIASKGRLKMKKKELGMVFSMVVGCLMASSSLYAHHSEAMLDKEHLVTLRGVVQEHRFVNPHQLIRFKVTDANGRVTPWLVQATPPGGLRDIGWTKDTLKPGDEVTITMHACKDGSPCGSWIRILMSDGTELPMPGIKKRFLAEYLELHGNEISDEDYNLYKRLATTGPGAVPNIVKGKK